MPKIPELGRGPVTAGGTVSPLNSKAAAPQINLNAIGAVNRSNAEMAEAFTDLGKQLFDKSKKLMIEEEVSQKRADYEYALREDTEDLQRQYNEPNADFSKYQEDYEAMLSDLGDEFDNTFNLAESKAAFASFKEAYNSRNLAQASVYQTKNLTHQLINRRKDSWQKEMRGVEARPNPLEASAVLTRQVESMKNINEQGGYFTPNDMDKQSKAYHKDALDSLMNGYMTKNRPGEALSFLNNKGSKHYENITKKVDAKVIAGWESRLKNLAKVNSGISKRKVRMDIGNLQKSVGSIEDTSAFEDLRDQVANGNFPDSDEIIDRLDAMEVADQIFKVVKEMPLEQKKLYAEELKKGDTFFAQAPKEFNTKAREKDRKTYEKMLEKDIEMMEEDTANYFAQNDESFRDMANKAVGLNDPDYVPSTREYLETASALFKEKGITEGKYVTEPMKDELLEIINSDDPALASREMEKIKAAWGEYSNSLFGAFGKDVDNDKLISITMGDETSRYIVLNNQKNKKEIEAKFKDTKHNKDEIQSETDMKTLKKISRSGNPQGGGDAVWGPILRNVELEAKRILSYDTDGSHSVTDAVEMAKERVFDANYATFQGILIPKDTVDPGDVEDFIDDFEDIADEYVSTEINKGFNPENGRWINDSTGITYAVYNGKGAPLAPVYDEEGNQIRVDFKDINSGEILRKLQAKKKEFEAKRRKGRPVGRGGSS